MQVLEAGKAGYEMVEAHPPVCYEQQPADWELALRQAMSDLRQKLSKREIELSVAAPSIFGQMHGEVQVSDDEGNARDPRL